MAALHEINRMSSGVPFEDSHTSDYIIIACSDPRYRIHLNEFEKQLGGKIDRIILPGGPLGFTAGNYGLTDTSKGLTEWTELLTGAHHVKEIILMSHAGCAAYGNAMKTAGQDLALTEQKQKDDLLKAREILSAKLPNVNIRLFMAEASVAFTEFGA